MKRAVELFAIEERDSASPLVERTWRTRSAPAEAFISVASSHWEMVVTRHEGASRLVVRGPETRATAVPIPRDAEFFGVVLSPGTFMPTLPPGRLVDRSVALPQVADGSVRLDGSVWEVPGPDDLEPFVAELARAGLLAHDPVVPEALRGEVRGLSTRSVERRVARATGLTRGAIRRVERAERAVELLSRGMSPLDAARLAGYADQPHLTRSLTRYVGQTPSQIGPNEFGGER